MTKVLHKVEQQPVRIPSGEVWLDGNLALPEDTTSIILFAHGSGSSRHSPRNQYVAGRFQEEGYGTLLMDLLTQEEEKFDMRTGELRFNIEFLAGRLADATRWIKNNEKTCNLHIGYFGASTGAAAALVAAVDRSDDVKAIVSRGGRPDLAGPALSQVKSPTLLIVGGYDYTVLELNRRALNDLTVYKELAIVPGATHLFEEAGALEEVARLSSQWFDRYLR